MAKRLNIPKKVIESITEHLSNSIDDAIDGFWSANEDEDTLTGHLGACLRTTHVQKVIVEREQQEEIFGTWSWSIDYTKFRGRGKAATESLLGADGIIELKLSFGNRADTKSLLFQSKLDWDSDSSLVSQAILLSNWREASIVLNYTPDLFEAYSIDSVVSSGGAKSRAKNSLDLKEALNDHFMVCKIGNTDLTYDARTRRLAWRSDSGVIVATQFSIPHRIRVHVNAPKRKDKFMYDKIISPGEIHTHRMQVENNELLMPIFSSSSTSLKKQKQVLSMAYHPDKFSSYSTLLQEIATKRMQEINKAYGEASKAANKREKANK